LQNSIKLIY